MKFRNLWNFFTKKNIKSVLVEAGGIFAGALLKNNCVDKIYQFIAPKILGNKNSTAWIDGLNVKNINEAIKFKIVDIKEFEPDIMLELEPLK